MVSFTLFFPLCFLFYFDIYSVFFLLSVLAAKSLGYSPPLHQSTHLIESEFTKMAEDSIMFLTILSPIQCQLALEIIILGFIALLDDNQRQSQGADVDYQHVLEHLVDVLPQVKVHLSSGKCVSLPMQLFSQFLSYETYKFLKIKTFRILNNCS